MSSNPIPKGLEGNAGKGRPPGVPNKNTAALKDMILKALDKAGGVDYLEEQAKKNPGPFMALIGKVLPMQVAGHDGGPLMITHVELRGVKAEDGK